MVHSAWCTVHIVNGKKMIDFEKLNVYQESINLAVKIYKLTKNFPSEEKFGIIDQLRRASVSISLNIAEGSSRTRKEFMHFLNMARGSCYELVPLMRISLQVDYINHKQHDEMYEEINVLAMRINALKKSLSVNNEQRTINY